MADINMNRPSKSAAESSVSTSQSSSNVVQDENRKTSTEEFEDLWGQLDLTESPPTSRVASPVPKNNYHHSHAHHNNNHGQQSQGQKRKRKIKIRVPRGIDPLSPSANMNEMFPVIDTVIRETKRRESHSSSSRSRHHHGIPSSHSQNSRNSNPSHTQTAHIETKTSNVPKTAIPCTASSSSIADVPLTKIPVADQSTSVMKTALSSSSVSTIQATKPSSPSKSQEPKQPTLASIAAVQQTSSAANIGVQPSPSPPQKVTQSSTSPQTIPHSSPSRSRHRPLQSSAPSEPGIPLPPGYEYMSDSQKQLFIEYQKQQQIQTQRSQRSTAVLQQHVPHSHRAVPQGIPSGSYHQPQRAHIKPLSSNIPVQPASYQSAISQQPTLPCVEPLLPGTDIPIQPVSFSPSILQQQQLGHSQSQQQQQAHQQQHAQQQQQAQQQQHQSPIKPLTSVPHSPVQPASTSQSVIHSPVQPSGMCQSAKHPVAPQQLQTTSQPSTLPRAQQPESQLSQSHGHSSQASNGIVKRKPETQEMEEDKVVVKKQKTEAQPHAEANTESKETGGPTAYHVGGENNLVVHAPTGCTFNIYQNKSEQQETRSAGGGSGYCRSGGCNNGGNNSGYGGGDNGRQRREKQHAIEWAGATTETDSPSQGHGENAGSQIPIPMFRDMAKSIARKWKFLARQLPMVEYGLLESELKELDTCKGDDTDKALAVLTKWWKENPDRWDAETMKKQLETALKECQLVRLARNIDEAFRALVNNRSLKDCEDCMYFTKPLQSDLWEQSAVNLAKDVIWVMKYYQTLSDTYNPL